MANPTLLQEVLQGWLLIFAMLKRFAQGAQNSAILPPKRPIGVRAPFVHHPQTSVVFLCFFDALLPPRQVRVAHRDAKPERTRGVGWKGSCRGPSQTERLSGPWRPERANRVPRATASGSRPDNPRGNLHPF